MSQIGTVEFHSQNGTHQVPIYDIADVDSPNDYLRVKTPNGIGIIPLFDPSYSSDGEMRIKTQSGILGMHGTTNLNFIVFNDGSGTRKRSSAYDMTGKNDTDYWGPAYTIAYRYHPGYDYWYCLRKNESYGYNEVQVVENDGTGSNTVYTYTDSNLIGNVADGRAPFDIFNDGSFVYAFQESGSPPSNYVRRVTPDFAGGETVEWTTKPSDAEANDGFYQMAVNSSDYVLLYGPSNHWSLNGSDGSESGNYYLGSSSTHTSLVCAGNSPWYLDNSEVRTFSYTSANPGDELIGGNYTSGVLDIAYSAYDDTIVVISADTNYPTVQKCEPTGTYQSPEYSVMVDDDSSLQYPDYSGRVIVDNQGEVYVSMQDISAFKLSKDLSTIEWVMDEISPSYPLGAVEVKPGRYAQFTSYF